MALPDFTMRQLLEAGVHFGHQSHRWNPKMAPFIFGERNNIHIIDLAADRADAAPGAEAVRDTVAKGGRVLFVGTKRQAQEPSRTPPSAGPVLRQLALARRHADQLEDDLGLDPARLRKLDELLAGDAAQA
jgi:small subunit ribosomal protein S2